MNMSMTVLRLKTLQEIIRLQGNRKDLYNTIRLISYELHK